MLGLLHFSSVVMIFYGDSVLELDEGLSKLATVNVSCCLVVSDMMLVILVRM